MNKNTNITSLDSAQITKYTYQEELDANRVFLVGGEKLELSVDNAQLAKAVQDGLSRAKLELPKEKEIQLVRYDVNVPVSVVDTIVQKVEVPVIIKEPIFRDVPVIVREQYTDIKKIEVPVIVKEYEVLKVEVPVVLENKFDRIFKISLLVLLGLLTISQYIHIIK